MAEVNPGFPEYGSECSASISYQRGEADIEILLSDMSGYTDTVWISGVGIRISLLQELQHSGGRPLDTFNLGTYPLGHHAKDRNPGSSDLDACLGPASGDDPGPAVGRPDSPCPDIDSIDNDTLSADSPALRRL